MCIRDSHRGTYTSQAHNKKMNRYLEFALAESEWLSSMAALAGGKSHKQELKEGWKIVLRNQFHDIIPGSSIHEVYEDSAKEYEEACRIEQEVRTSALSCLTVQEEGDVYKRQAWRTMIFRSICPTP